MKWKIEYSTKVFHALKRIDKPTRQRILKRIRAISQLDDPRQQGKPLTGRLAGLWRYREGDWRIICLIHDDTVTVYVVDTGHRSSIYKKLPKRQREITYDPISLDSKNGGDLRIDL